MATYTKDYILGDGGFYVGDTCIGLTRGGGQFIVERTYRKVAADGDKGGVKGRIVVDESIPKLTVNLLEVINPNISKYWPAMKHTDTQYNSSGAQSMKGSCEIDDTNDYIDEVKWVGKTKKGKPIVIKVYRAINLENIDFTMQEKNEIVPKITWEGTYPEDFDHMADTIEEPWEIIYPTVDSIV